MKLEGSSINFQESSVFEIDAKHTKKITKTVMNFNIISIKSAEIVRFYKPISTLKFK